MNYQRIYNNIICKAQERNWNRKTAKEYVERHHIIPKSLGGTDKIDNLVFLTAREHFICHWLLYKIVTGINKSKMANAWFRMCQTNEFQIRYSSKNYEFARKAFSKNNPFKEPAVIKIVKDRMLTSNPMKNPKIADKVRKALKGKYAGSKNRSYDHTIYKWENIHTGEIVAMTRYDLYTTYNLRPGQVGRVALKVPGYNSVKGWTINL